MFSRYRGAFLSWIAVPVSFSVFLFFLTGLISISYHPIAPGVHLIPVRIALAAIGMLVCFALAIRHGTKKRRTLILRNALELAAAPVILLITFQILAANYQQPDYLRLTYGGDTFGIPRIYRPHQSSERSSHPFINVSVCRKTGAPIYTGPCTSTSGVELNARPMIEQFKVRPSLDQAGATYKGDEVTSRGSDAEELSDGSFNYSQGPYRNRFLLSNSGQIERFAHCYPVTKTCTVLARTPQGILRFDTRMTDADAISFWRDEEKKWLTDFAGWKCAETTCGGRFD